MIEETHPYPRCIDLTDVLHGFCFPKIEVTIVTVHTSAKNGCRFVFKARALNKYQH